MEFFCNTKDRTAIKNFLVYEFTCPGCGTNCVGKTKGTLYERCIEYAWSDQDSIVKITSTIVLKCSVFLMLQI